MVSLYRLAILGSAGVLARASPAWTTTLDSTSSSSSVPSSTCPSTAPSSTVAQWPCTPTDGVHKFALKLTASDFNGKYLGVSPDGNTVVGDPSVNDTTALWYINGTSLYVDPATTRNGTALKNAPVMAQPFDNNWDEFQGVWTFNTTYTMTQCYGICYSLSCVIQPSSSVAYGHLNCINGYNSGYFIQPGGGADAYFGVWDESQTGGGTYGRPAEETDVMLIPSCQL